MDKANRLQKELTLIEITDDRPIREWAKEIMGARNTEAVASLEAENVVEETVFYVELDGKRYLAFFMKGKDMRPADMEQEINKTHLKVLHSIKIKKIDGELLYDFESPAE